MLVELTLSEALAAIGATEPVWSESIVPARTPLAANSPYRAEYGWLFHWEREIARRLEPWCQGLRQELLGSGGLVSEALANAYCHGHRRDPFLPIEVSLWAGAGGVLLRVVDQGAGFCARSAGAQLRAGRRYFEHAGSGLRSMERSSAFEVFFTDHGSAFQLLRRLEVGAPRLTGS